MSLNWLKNSFNKRSNVKYLYAINLMGLFILIHGPEVQCHKWLIKLFSLMIYLLSAVRTMELILVFTSCHFPFSNVI